MPTKLTPQQIAASILGRIGGSKTSAKKKAASKANGLKGGTTKRALRIQKEKNLKIGQWLCEKCLAVGNESSDYATPANRENEVYYCPKCAEKMIGMIWHRN